MLRLARLACLLGTLAFAGPTFAQTIDMATPTSVAVGSTLTITGSGFGLSKPKVLLFDGATEKKYTLKVDTFTDTTITATIKKAVLGDLTLQVIVKGVALPLEGPDAIRVEAPLVTSLSTTEADPDEEFTIFGDYFGIKKSRILVGSAKAKVLSWTMNEIHVLMPKKLFNGLFNVTVDNKVGIDDAASVTVVNSLVKIGKATLNLSLDGSALKFKYTPGVPVAGHLVLVGVSASNPSQNLSMVVPFNAATESAPKSVTAGATLLINYVETGKVSGFQIPPVATWTASGLGVGSIDVLITASSGGQVAGTVDCMLVLQVNTFGTSKPQLVHLTGDFILDV